MTMKVLSGEHKFKASEMTRNMRNQRTMKTMDTIGQRTDGLMEEDQNDSRERMLNLSANIKSCANDVKVVDMINPATV